MNEPASFGAWIKQRRKERRLTQEALAEAAACSWEMLRKVEAGSARPSTQLADLLLAALGVPTAERPALVELARDKVQRRGATAQTTPALPAGQAAPVLRLPNQPTTFVGRQAEVAYLANRLREPATRLLTLTGPGGVGKTRLALHVATALHNDYPDGVYFVDLAPITEPRLVVSAVAEVLDVAEPSERPLLAALQDALAGKQLLLVLDNFEQVLQATDAVDTLLKATTQLKILATSRIPLHIYGEKEYAVPPLALPIRAAATPMEQVTQYEAVKLFIERALDVKADFTVTNESAPSIAEICMRLDGLPLAIELAAARIKLLSPPAMLARLDQRLKLLTGGASNLPPRQRTLRAAIDWSYDLLDEGEQQLFRRLAVFNGGRSLEAIEVICAGGSTATAHDQPAIAALALDILDAVASLVNKSLLQQREDADGEPRFWMLETIHEYAREKLRESGEDAAIKARHIAYFTALAEAARPYLLGAGQVEWLLRLEKENDNLRAVFSWAREHDATEAGLRLGAALWRFWEIRGYMSEGSSWLATFLERSRGSNTLARAGALRGAGALAWLQQDFLAARDYVIESLAICRSLGDNAGVASALINLGNVARDQGDYDAATARYEESLAVNRALGDRRGISVVLNNLGIMALYRGEYAHTTSFCEESLALRQQLGDRWGIAISLHTLAEAARAQGEYSRAVELYERSLALRRALGDRRGIADTLSSMARAVGAAGDQDRMARLLIESIELFQLLDHEAGIGDCLRGLSTVAQARGAMEQATLLLGAAASLHATQGAVPWIIGDDQFNAALPAIRQALGNTIFEARFAAGAGLPLADAIRLARTVARDAGSAPA